MEQRALLKGHGLALFTVSVWGTTFISTKLLLAAFHPVELILLRFTLAWAVLFLMSPRPLKPTGWRQELTFMGAGLTGLTLYFLLENSALSYTLASNVGIIISAAPLFTALLLWGFRMAPRPGVGLLAGFVIALSGITLLSLGNGEGLSADLLGNLLTVGAALSWGFYSVFTAKLRDCGYTTLQATRKVFFWGVLFTIPVWLFTGTQPQWTALTQPVMAGNLLYLGLIASAMCYVTWSRSMAIIGTTATSVYIYLTPVITMAASAWILGERITPTAILATGLILVGLWLSQRGLKNN